MADPAWATDPGPVERAFVAVPGVRALCAPLLAVRIDTRDAAEVRARGAVEKRVREYAAGRALARLALQQAGVADRTVATSPRRYPVWPSGMVGSITHSDLLVAVAIAKRSDYGGIGIDIERECAVPDSVVDSVLLPVEKSAGAPDENNAHATRIFSCKEALYKAVYPRTHEFLDFQDVEVTIGDGTFTAQCAADKKAADLVAKGRGYIEHRGEHVLALFVA